MRKFLFNSGLLILSTVVSYAIGEIIVRVWFPQPMLPRYVVDAPYGIRVNKPNMSMWHTSPDYHVNVRINSRGVRADREIPYEKPSGVYRVLGLGDSFTLGYEVDIEDTYLCCLERKLHEKGATGVEVVNLSVSGFGTAEELITLKEEGLKYSPDMVVLGYFGNDVENNITSNLYSIHGDSLRREAASYLPAVGIRKVLYDIPGYKFLAEESQLWNIFRNRISHIVQQGLYKKNRELELQRTKGDSANLARQDSIVNEYGLTLTARLLDEITIECLKRGIKFVLVNIPYARTSSAIESNIPVDRMRCLDSLIYVDAENVILPYHGKKEIHWEKWHGHWRPWVHRLFADVLADTVLQYLPIASESRSRP